MENSHCIQCNNKTKLLLKVAGKHIYVCKQASLCPFTKKKDGEETKLILEEKQ